MKRRRSVPVLLATAVLMVFAACGGDDDVSETVPTTAATTTTTLSATMPATTSTTTLAGSGEYQETTTPPAAATTTTATTTTTTEPDPNVVAIQVAFENGEVVAEESRVKVPLGKTVELTVTSDTGDEIHVHGYDVFADVAPGVPGTLVFEADIPGIFEVEFEGSHLLLIELEVS